MGNQQKIKKCKSCGKDLDKSAKICPSCGKDQRSFFGKHKIITGIIVLAIIGGIGSGGNVEENKENEIASADTKQQEVTTSANTSKEKEEKKEKEETIEINASDLYKAYDSNEVKADKNYKDKGLEITGKVSDIGVTLGQTYVCLSTGEYSAFSVQCFFDDDSEIDKVSELDKGDTVTIYGTCTGMSLNVVVNNCKLK
ncbi:MAG: hypothetical protein SOT71_13110 [Romboutsia timonensis]|uniref:OB-fold protein n=1 Tax=Romboutsia timonensis TaxID=1776391 RepID=UPI002A765FD6|nr:hypothetical protein [Romboutsia timonensis]MDY2883583.1 hypothetical protein [Romboutsia timonensis]